MYMTSQDCLGDRNIHLIASQAAFCKHCHTEKMVCCFVSTSHDTLIATITLTTASLDDHKLYNIYTLEGCYKVPVTPIRPVFSRRVWGL